MYATKSSRFSLKARLGIFLGALILFSVDRLSKELVKTYLDPSTFIPLFPTFALQQVHNPGVAFGILGSFPDMVLWFNLFAVSVVALFTWISPHRPGFFVAFSLILGGSMGNVTDRLLHGYVIDFLSFTWWPAFNLADIFIVMGVALLSMGVLRTPKTSPALR